MSKSTSLSATTITSLTVLGGLLAYAAYFDYRRRNDTVFRKKLRVEKKKAEKAAAEDKAREAEEAAKQGPLFKLSPDEVLELYAKAREDAIPENVDGRKAYFDQNLSRAELLSSQGVLH
ncbi:hypothetical protein BD410DRAFT_27233 [Rickenella mellea]|uniref:Uncharacterized protein n=1 Tax=Rickenella mellea TaxID=50990 RepID=A0A4R5XEL0_9AGAM|nr:hypothetical protein BD410DRAFT_27233 [Rickenella mellea]